MSTGLCYAALCGAAVLLMTTAADSHEIVGNRMFPATLAIDDPGVADELALPTIAFSKTGDDISVKQLDISGEYSKRITEDFALSFAPTWTHLYTPGGPTMTGAGGFQNLETAFKYRLYKNAEHEFVMSVGHACCATTSPSIRQKPFGWRSIRRSPEYNRLYAMPCACPMAAGRSTPWIWRKAASGPCALLSQAKAARRSCSTLLS